MQTCTGIASRPHVRASKLKCWKSCGIHGGYNRWRDMQLVMNLQMCRVLKGIGQISILKKSDEYVSDFFRRNGAKSLDDLLDNDPCSDADVRFFAHDAVGNKRPPRISEHSVLLSKRDESIPVQLVLVGTYQHICISLVYHDKRTIEFFDSRGHNEELDQIRSFFRVHFSGFRFFNVNSAFDIQASKKEEGTVNKILDEGALDVFCHTWIYLYAYRRLIKNEERSQIIRMLRERSPPDRLRCVQRFQGWLFELGGGSSSDSLLTQAAINGFVAPSPSETLRRGAVVLARGTKDITKMRPLKRSRRDGKKKADGTEGCKRRSAADILRDHVPLIDVPRQRTGRWVDHGTAHQRVTPPRVYRQLPSPPPKIKMQAGVIIAHRWLQPKGWFIGQIGSQLTKGSDKGMYFVSYGKSSRYGGTAHHGLLPEEYGSKKNWVVLQLVSGRPAVF